jgi:hypothetical protein
MVAGDIKRIWFHRVDEVCNLEALGTLEKELGRAGLAAAISGPVRLKIIDKKLQLAKAMPSASSTQKAPAFAARYGLPAPDGRALYAYRLTDPGFAGLTKDLAAQDITYFENGYGPGLFVLWAAEWFRREYQGGFLLGQTLFSLWDFISIKADCGKSRTLVCCNGTGMSCRSPARVSFWVLWPAREAFLLGPFAKVVEAGRAMFLKKLSAHCWAPLCRMPIWQWSWRGPQRI